MFFTPDTYHRVAPVRSGVRFSLVAWFRKPDVEFWGRDALLSTDSQGCAQLFPLLGSGIPASFTSLPLPAAPSILVSATRGAAGIQHVAVENAASFGPPAQLCMVVPGLWADEGVCATSEPGGHSRRLPPRAGVREPTVVVSAPCGERLAVAPCL